MTIATPGHGDRTWPTTTIVYVRLRIDTGQNPGSMHAASFAGSASSIFITSRGEDVNPMITGHCMKYQRALPGDLDRAASETR